MRFVRHPEAVLRIFGDGQERRRMARAARRWGVADRVRFEGRVPRDELLRIVATAGVFFHPAFHDEAGLAVASLSLGTPVVCLDRGGPPELLRHWPSTCADAVTPESPEKTARAFAAAIDRYLSNPPPVLTSARRSNTSFENELLAAYDIAFKAGLDHAHRPQLVWAFPAGKPQVFAATPRALSKGVMVYAASDAGYRDGAACLGRAGATADTAPAARGTYSRPDARVWLDHLACRSRRSLSAQRSILVGMDPFPVAVGQAAVEHARTRQRGDAQLVRCD